MPLGEQVETNPILCKSRTAPVSIDSDFAAFIVYLHSVAMQTRNFATLEAAPNSIPATRHDDIILCTYAVNCFGWATGETRVPLFAQRFSQASTMIGRRTFCGQCSFPGPGH
jgi:hypothetical protein